MHELNGPDSRCRPNVVCPWSHGWWLCIVVHTPYSRHRFVLVSTKANFFTVKILHWWHLKPYFSVKTITIVLLHNSMLFSTCWLFILLWIMVQAYPALFTLPQYSLVEKHRMPSCSMPTCLQEISTAVVSSSISNCLKRSVWDILLWGIVHCGWFCAGTCCC